MLKIGFIGLGHMGAPMAQHLIVPGHELKVMDLNENVLQPLLAAGASRAHSLKALATWADVIFTSVQTGKQMESICFGEEGLFAHSHADLLLIDCSSIEIHITQLLHRQATQLKLAMLDAPVSGGAAGAKAGTLTFMVGGEENVFLRSLPLLKLMGKKIVHAGPAGSGGAAKICNNLLLAISMIGVAEAFNLAEKMGLSAEKFFEISSNSSGQCWSMTSYCPVPNLIANVPANQNYEPGFMAKMMLKDLLLGQNAAQHVHANIPLGLHALRLYEQFIGSGAGELDFSAIIQMIATEKVLT